MWKTENNNLYCPFFYLFFGCDFATWLSMQSTFMTLQHLTLVIIAAVMKINTIVTIIIVVTIWY